MNTTNTHTGAASFGNAVERLLKSADSLDFALAGQDKKNASLSRQGLLDFGSFDTVLGSTELSTSLFDDWLSGDLKQVGFSNEDSSSSSDSDSGRYSPALSSKSDSPALGFDSIATDTDLIRSPAFESPMGFFPDMQLSASRLFGNVSQTNNSATATVNAISNAAASPTMPLTPEAVQQAAAALNIPWSKALEQAVLAQSLLASLPMTLPNVALSQSAMPSIPFVSTAAATAVASMLPNHGASINVAHDNAMDISPPSTPAMPMSPVTPSASLFKDMDRALSTTPSSPATAAPSTPRLSILSSIQTRLPVANTTIQATTYKSTYRSASLQLKRSREIDEVPSVLDGKDITEMDEVALKRAKNTDAARRSRHKKLIRMESLEQRVAELEVENSMFESKLNEVELERSLLADKDQMQQTRIQELELMLASVREKLF
ncbi:hypothetical protein EDD11_002253 [Mortierella claussenii]|nr:hypothetical protein EDD11_002253 [Mortierella claussenii]